MINGIQSHNGYYGYQNRINQQRLNNIFGSTGNRQAISPVPSIPAYGQNSSELTDSISYLKQYSSSMTDLMSAANSMRSGNSGSVVNQMDPVSSDSAILDASRNGRISSNTSIEVTVDQLAKSQINTSDAVSTAAKSGSDIAMQLTTGSRTLDIQIRSTDAKGNQKTNGQMLSETAAAINKTGAGVKASVITKDGKSSLQLESVKTGNSNTFSVSGDFADKSGIGKVTQMAQNASYSVTANGRTTNHTSESNQVSTDFGKISMTLKKEGTATISVGVDSQKVASAMEDFVKSYNSTISLLSKNQDRGSGNLRQMSSLKDYVMGSEKSMEKLGLSFRKDGSLTLDKEKLISSLEKEPSLTKDLISGSSGLAQRAFSTAQSGASASAGSLVGNDVAQYDYQQEMNSFNFMNSMSRKGAYTMMNYNAVGMMLNMMV